MTLSHLLLVSLPNLLTIFVAAGLLCSLFPLRGKASKRIALACIACVGLSIASNWTSSVLSPLVRDSLANPLGTSLVTPLFFGATLVILIPIAHVSFEMNWWDAVFCCSGGYALQNVAHVLYELAEVLLGVGENISQLASTIIHLAISAAVFTAFYVTFIRSARTHHIAGGIDKIALVGFVVVLLVNIVIDAVGADLQEAGQISNAGFVLLRLSQLVSSMLALAFGYVQLYSRHAHEDAVALHRLMEDQQHQYQVSRDTIEAINVRCHDIRHQIRNLQVASARTKTSAAPEPINPNDAQNEVIGSTAVDGAPSSTAAFLTDASRLVSIYDASVSTGNPALDTILTEKSLLCQQQSIELTCTVDGSLLSFMDEQDVYSLFGNALDNAIQATKELDDPERRVIDVSSRATRGMVLIQVRNFFKGSLEFEDGLPKTTHEGPLHGYGMKSLRLVAERYGGSLTVDATDGIFHLRVLLPRTK